MKLKLVGSQVVIGVLSVIAAAQDRLLLAVLLILCLILIELSCIRQAIEGQRLSAATHSPAAPAGPGTPDTP
jgi:hypothetical protein